MNLRELIDKKHCIICGKVTEDSCRYCHIPLCLEEDCIDEHIKEKSHKKNMRAYYRNQPPNLLQYIVHGYHKEAELKLYSEILRLEERVEDLNTHIDELLVADAYLRKRLSKLEARR